MVGFLLFLYVGDYVCLAVSFGLSFIVVYLQLLNFTSIGHPLEFMLSNPWAIPLLGSSVLLASGFVLTLPFINGCRGTALLSLLITVLLAFSFL